jgi:hypothetical protein
MDVNIACSRVLWYMNHMRPCKADADWRWEAAVVMAVLIAIFVSWAFF